MNFKFIKMAAVVLPKIDVDKKNEIVKYGKNNRYPNELLDISIQSSLHTAILDKKITMSKGEGLASDDKKTQKWIESPNPYESLDDIYEKIATDLEIFGGFAIETIWSKDKKSIAEIYHIPFQNIRSTKMNEKNQVDTYLYHEDWKSYTRYTEAKAFPAFNSSDNKDLNQLLYAKKYSATNRYYPLPSYQGGIADINTLNEISIFHNSCIKNNFNPGILIFFKGPIPSVEEQDLVVEALEEKYAGAENAGSPGIFWVDENMIPQIENLAVSDLDKQYSTLTEAIKESVVMGHQIPRIVAGLEKTGSLGGSKEIIESNAIFHQEYVSKQQQFICNYLNKIGAINGYKEVYVKNSTIPLHLFSESLLTQTLTKEEIRELFGFTNDVVEVVPEIKNNNDNADENM